MSNSSSDIAMSMESSEHHCHQIKLLSIEKSTRLSQPKESKEVDGQFTLRLMGFGSLGSPGCCGTP